MKKKSKEEYFLNKYLTIIKNIVPSVPNHMKDDFM